MPTSRAFPPQATISVQQFRPPFLKFEFEIISQYGVYMRRNPSGSFVGECPMLTSDRRFLNLQCFSRQISRVKKYADTWQHFTLIWQETDTIKRVTIQSICAHHCRRAVADLMVGLYLLCFRVVGFGFGFGIQLLIQQAPNPQPKSKTKDGDGDGDDCRRHSSTSSSIPLSSFFVSLINTTTTKATTIYGRCRQYSSHPQPLYTILYSPSTTTGSGSIVIEFTSGADSRPATSQSI